MDQLEKVGKKLLGSQIEDSLMEYILNEPVAIGEKLPMNSSWRRSSAWDGAP